MTDPGTPPALELCDARLTLSSKAGEVEILKGVDLTVRAGETVGVVGPSGSGKSSLLMLLGGLERATGGGVFALGHDLTAMDEDALARFRRDHMGVVFQSFHLIPNDDGAWKTSPSPLELRRRSGRFRPRCGGELRPRRPRPTEPDHYPAQLSGGEQQRVALARAAAPEPDILLADEPTGNLDAATGASIADLLFETQARRGATMVLVTHAPELAARCDRVAQVSDGRVTEGAAAAEAAE